MIMLKKQMYFKEVHCYAGNKYFYSLIPLKKNLCIKSVFKSKQTTV